MTRIFEFSFKIHQLTKENKFTEALNYFKENKSFFSKEEIASNEFLVSNIIKCLRHTKKFHVIDKFLDAFNIEISNNQKEIVLCAYGWLLWEWYKLENKNIVQESEEEDFSIDNDDNETQNITSPKNEILEKIGNLLPIIMSLESQNSSKLISCLFSLILRTEKKKANKNWKIINDFCDKIDKEKLSKECRTTTVKHKEKLKTMELASDFENWYAYKTKALMKLGKWQECLELSKEALTRIEKFHYQNEIWFLRRIALSKKHLGNLDDAIEELNNIIRKKKEWYIQKELAELYYEKGDIEMAFKFAIDAINNHGDLEFKVDLLMLLGSILKKKNELELSFKHFSLSKLIRQSEGWKIPLKLNEELKKFTFTEIKSTEFQKLKNELLVYWKTFNELGSNASEKSTKLLKQYNEGTVIKILHDNERGKDGFIRGEGKDYYFSIKRDVKFYSEIKIGSKVLFEISPNQNDRVKTIKKVIC